MARISLSGVLNARRKRKILTGISCLILIGMFVQFVVFDSGRKTAKACINSNGGFSLDGSTITLGRSCSFLSFNTDWYIDTDGQLYKFNRQNTDYDYYLNDGWTNSTTPRSIDPRYYAGLIDTDRNFAQKITYNNQDLNFATNFKDINLIVENGANVITAGTQSFKNLTVQNGGKVTASYQDSDGKIKKPLFDNDYWAMRLTGFLKIDPYSTNWINSSYLDDDISIEAGYSSYDPSTGNITGTDTISNSTKWWVVYRKEYSTSDGSSNWNIKSECVNPNMQPWCSGINQDADNNGNINITEDQFQNRSHNLATLQLLSNINANAEKYVPIRISFHDVTSEAHFKLAIQKYDYSVDRGSFAKQGSNITMTKSVFYPATGNDGLGSVDTTKAAQMYLEYFIPKNRAQNDGISYNLDNNWTDGVVVRTATKNNLNLTTDLKGYDPTGLNKVDGGQYGCFGDLNAKNNNDFQFNWETNNSCYYQSPIGGIFNIGDHNRTASFKGPGIYSNSNDSDADLTHHYGGNLLNNDAFDKPVRYTATPLSLDITGTLNVNGHIDVTGSGYAGGYTNLDTRIGTDYTYMNGKGIGGGQSSMPNGSLATNGVGGGGGGHGGKGGAGTHNGDTGWNFAPGGASYDSQFDPIAFGSGGAVGNLEESLYGGAGGGAIKINAVSINLDTVGAIIANGDPGQAVRIVGSLGGNGAGSGGSIYMTTSSLNVTLFGAMIQAIGGDGQNSTIEHEYGGSGGGGRIAIYSPSMNVDKNAFISSVNDSGGSVTNNLGFPASLLNDDKIIASRGEHGTIYISANAGTSPVRKTLTPVSRNGVANTTFNPYALQENDVIQVDITVSNLSGNADITDDLLAGGGMICYPEDIGAGSLSGTTLLWAGQTASSGKVTVSYKCKVQKK